MVNANLIIIRILMIWPSVMLGLFFCEIIKITGVLLPDNIPTRVGMLFYIFTHSNSPGIEISQKNPLASAKIFEKNIFFPTTFCRSFAGVLTSVSIRYLRSK